MFRLDLYYAEELPRYSYIRFKNVFHHAFSVAQLAGCTAYFL